MKTISEQIEHGMAIAFFASAYADQAEECGQPLRGEITEQLSATIDKAALHAANTLKFDLLLKFIARYPDKLDAGASDLTPVFEFAQSLDATGADRELTPELFGHYLAMQAMGAGVGLESFGDAVHEAIPVPSALFGSYSLERDYFEQVGDDE